MWTQICLYHCMVMKIMYMHVLFDFYHMPIHFSIYFPFPCSYKIFLLNNSKTKKVMHVVAK